MKLVILATEGRHTDIMVHALDDAGIPPVAVLIEPAQSRKALLRGRAHRLGWGAVIGQVLFMALVLPLLRRRSGARVEDIRSAHDLRFDALPADRLTPVPSVNASQTRDILQRIAPDAVVLSGTRIVKPQTLDAAGAPVLNIHAGITPEYRGVHGGYWALWAAQPQDFGATVHLVDKGVDTGGVLTHVRPTPAREDNFVTYPLVQLAAALPPLIAILKGLGQGLPDTVPTTGEGQQWYHPTLMQYLSGLRRGVR